MKIRPQFVKIIACFMALTVAVPPSYAGRLGGGRSVGRQSAMPRQRMAPAPVQRQQQAPQVAPQPAPLPVQPAPGFARQGPPAIPYQTPPRQAGAPWGGMLGGALVGLGLGSLLSSPNRQVNPASSDGTDRQRDGRPGGTASSGNGADGSTGSGTGDANVSPQANPASMEEPRESRIGLLLLAFLVLAGFWLFRRSRMKAAQRRF